MNLQPRPQVHQFFQTFQTRHYNNVLFVGMQHGNDTAWMRIETFNACQVQIRNALQTNNLGVLAVVELKNSILSQQFGCFQYLTFTWIEVREDPNNTFLVRAQDGLTVFF